MSSRVLVKNIPKYTTPEQLKKHFTVKGARITDVKLVKTKDGESRRFAYIGFKTDKEGSDAISYFNNSFIDTSRITVEVAKSIGDDSIPRAWSKYSTSSSAHQRRTEAQNPTPEESPVPAMNEKQKDFLKDLDTDGDFNEFLSVMRPRQAAANRTWGNDDILAAQSTMTPILKTEDDDLYQDLPSNFPDDVEDEEDELMTDVVLPETDGDGVAFDNTISDMEYLKLKMKKSPEIEVAVVTKPQQETMRVNPGRMAILQEVGAVDADVVNIFEQPVSIISNEMGNESHAVEAEELPVIRESEYIETPSPDLIADTGRIMVRNLAYSCTYEDLDDHFKRYGPISEIHLPIDKITKESKGYAFILYMIPENAVKAFTLLDRTIFQGRIMEIVAAKEKLKSEEVAQGGPMNFKSKREHDQKSKASSDFNWNSLFMNSDAVAEAMARNLGVRKSEILDASSDNMAVRLALAETNIITDTKKYLEDHDVSLEAFTAKKTRSNTVILVKNIPASTEEEDLLQLFTEFGTIGRILLPPARTIALVEFSERNEAKVAFRKLAYSKFKGIPLYLEWAPEGTFVTDYDPKAVEEKRKQKAADQIIKIQHDDTEDLAPAATVFVKNLNFETSDEGFLAAFNGLGGLRSARISKKANPKYPGQKQSMGFGFLEFQTKDEAMKCIKTMQKFNLDGHELALKFSTNAAKPSETSKKRATASEANEKATKVLVRNLPFEATKKDLKELFSSFGSIKTVRIPRKFDGQHRGFGFVDFLTPQEAKNALEALSATHLYGRHLVLEWAKEEETVEEMREKTAKGFVKDGGKPKKRKIIENEEVEDYDN